MATAPGKAPRGALAVVAAGQAGDSVGWAASRLAAVTPGEHYFAQSDGNPLSSLQQATGRTNNTAFSFRGSSNAAQTTPFGTAIAAAALVQQRVFLLTIGNSRAFLIRNQQVVLATSERSGRELLGQNAILQLPVSGRPDNRYSFVIDLEPGDVLVLCTPDV